MFKVLFNAILVKSKNFDLVQQYMEPILNEYAWDDLKLLYGTPTDPGYHLLSRINRTTTSLGKAILATLLITPTSDLTLLRHRQNIIQAFLDHTLGAAKFKNCLQTYKKIEQNFISFWTNTQPLPAVQKHSLWFWERAFLNFLTTVAQILSPFVKLGIAFAYYDLTKQSQSPWYSYIPFLRSLYAGGIATQKIWEIVKHRPMSEHNVTSVFFELASGGFSESSAFSGLSSVREFLDRIIGEDMFYFITCWQRIKACLAYSSQLRDLALRMADVQTFIVVATQISEAIATLPALEEVYGKHLTSIRQLLAQSQENTELRKLIHYLKHLPLQHWSLFWNNENKLLASVRLFIEHKDAFSDAMYELGQLDAYLSLATLMQEAQANDSNHAYTFVKFLDRKQKSTPYIKIDQMWNPFLDAKQAVGNSIEMDGAPGGVRNIILTGPNAGGKSTFLTSVVGTLLLAHVAGIGPAEAIQLTPFNKDQYLHRCYR
ncbi:MAG: hypothetical protein AAF400_02735 [Bacteroidota bacterium]